MDNEAILLRVDPFIWQDESLNYPEKIMLNLVFSFTIRGECCSLTDQWIGNKFGWSAQFSRELIQLLSNRGWIKIHPQWDGTRNLSLHIPGSPDPCDPTFPAEEVEV
jgi:hypothetical protein